MNDWVAKRFWTTVGIEDEGTGFGIRLDGRAVRTPAKAALVVPTCAMADAIAREWEAVEGKINPNIMPYTRSANAAIDKVSVQFEEVAEMLAAYGGSDLVCYRASGPDGLIARQSEGWDPLLNWAQQSLGARLHKTIGVMPVEQSSDALDALGAPLFAASAFELTALHDLIALSGSLVLGLAVAMGRLSADEAWSLSRIDEDWQAEQWGADEVAVQMATIKQAAFAHAAQFYKLAILDQRG